jgi:alginate O-acetyltransferase complex protein AlgI
MGEMADDIFNMNIHLVSTPTAWIGILAYTFQIYFDFSGYSDMAIGIAKMVGFIFPENFNNPYTSQSITEFWRRWHITLGAWMKNYLYIPLGGNRVKTNRRLYFNLWLVFILSGLWHGASWNFIIWGAYNGLFLILDRMFLIKALHFLNKPLRVLLTFLIVVIGWVFFRVEHLHDAISFIHKLFSFDFGPVHDLSGKFIFILFLATLFSFFTVPGIGQKIQEIVYGTYHINYRHFAFAFASLVLFIVCLGAVTTSNFNPFIYFRF